MVREFRPQRGQYISYANCGLPYHVGGVIPNRDSLVVMSPEKFKGWFNVDVRNNSEVASIDRAEKSVVVRGPAGEYVETYDKLVFGGMAAIPLAGLANKQGRIVANNLVGRSSRYLGSYGASKHSTFRVVM